MAQWRNGASMSSAYCQWLRGGQQVDDRAYSGGNTGWVPAVVGGPALAVFGSSHCGGIPVEVTKLSPVYSLLSPSHSFILVSLYTRFHKGGNRVCIATFRM
jgi:hypothetical protein